MASAEAAYAKRLSGWDEAWRAAEVEQRVLDNARVLWQRCVDQTRIDANDRANQLKNLANLSAIIAGFSMSSFLEFNFDPVTVPTGVLVLYGVTTALVAAIYMSCMASCNLILGTVMQVSGNHITVEEESHFLLQCREFAIRYRRADCPPAPPRSFQRLWDIRCAPSWRITLILFAAGIPLFLVNMAASSWIKFAVYTPGAALMTAIMGIGLLYLAFANTQWIVHLIKARKTKHKVAALAVEPQGLPWDWHLEPQIYPKALPYSPPSTKSYWLLTKRSGRTDELTRWKEEDLEQQHMENALALWMRFERTVRTDMNERAEQLRSLSFLATILLSFGMAALYQLNFDVTTFPGVLDILYALTVALTVALNVCTLTICGFLNMTIVRVGASLASQEERAHFLARCHRFVRGHTPGAPPPHPLRTFGNYWTAKCDRDWRIAFRMFFAGAVLFQLCLICSAWLKFAPRNAPRSDHQHAAEVMTGILGLGVVYFCFTSIRWARGHTTRGREERARWATRPPAVGLPFDWHLPPTRRDGRAQHVGSADVHPAEPAFAPSPESPYAGLRAPVQQEAGTGYSSAEDESWEDGVLWGPHMAEQKHLSHALVLWKRFTDANLNDLEERSEQLKAVTDLAAIIAGFEMIAFLQFQFDSTKVNRVLQLAYVATCGATVALMAAAMTLCGIMLESILESSSEFINPAQEADFIAKCRAFCRKYRPGDRPPAPRKSFKHHWDTRCEMEWRRAFYMFSLGVPAFLANAAVTSWIKFAENHPPAVVVTVMQGLAVLYLVLSHARWARHLVGGTRASAEETRAPLLPAGLPFDWHLPPSRRQASVRKSNPPAVQLSVG